jgi:uncharacterized heparinase superfamily protein
MLRKSYRLMQKTKTLIDQTRTEMGTLYARTFDAPLPTEFSCCPPDVFTGDAARGAEMVSYVFGLRPEKLRALFAPATAHLVDARFHGFGWLNDLQSDGTPEARRAAVMCLEAWIAENAMTNAVTWTPDLIAERLLRFTGTYAFYAPLLDPEMTIRLVESYGRQAQKLKHALHDITDALSGIRAAAGLIAAGVALGENAGFTHAGIQSLERHVRVMVLSDGGPHTRTPSDLPALLQLLIDARGRLQAAALPVPAFLAHAIDRVVPALRFFRMGDARLSVFHGGSEGNPVRIEELVRLADSGAGIPHSLPYAGFERLSAADVTLVVDTGSVDAHAPAHLHASLLSFEMSVGVERLIVNCGQHAHDAMWRDLLSATAAHSTLSLEDMDNVIVPRGRMMPRGCGARVTSGRGNDGRGVLLACDHDGYLTRNGFTHARKFYLDMDGVIFKGQDDLSTAIPPITPVGFAARFHLHPDVDAAMTRGGGVLLRLPSGSGWSFECEGGTVSVEDSVYLGATGLPRKTRQIVVAGRIYGAAHTLRWAFTLNNV